MKGWKQRELEFRAYFPEESWVYKNLITDYEITDLKPYHYINNFHESGWCNELWTNPVSGINKGMIVVQYTGVKDSNGKKIFEGDIVQYNNPYNSYGIIKYIHTDTVCGFELAQGCICKILGNVFQNPELVEKYNLEVVE